MFRMKTRAIITNTVLVSLVFACPLAVLMWINKLCYESRAVDKRDNDQVNSGRIMGPTINTARSEKY